MEQYEARVAGRCEVGKGCCALRILKAEDDFRNDVIRAAGHDVILYPSFIANSITLSIIGLPSNSILEQTVGIPFRNSRLPF